MGSNQNLSMSNRNHDFSDLNEINNFDFSVNSLGHSINCNGSGLSHNNSTSHNVDSKIHIDHHDSVFQQISSPNHDQHIHNNSDIRLNSDSHQVDLVDNPQLMNNNYRGEISDDIVDNLENRNSSDSRILPISLNKRLSSDNLVDLKNQKNEISSSKVGEGL